MNITRQTKLYKQSFTKNNIKTEVYFRDLTSLEVSFLFNIKNDIVRYDTAANIVIYNIDPQLVPIGTRIKIGEDILVKAQSLIGDKQMLEITVSEFRSNIKTDDIMMSIKHIMGVFPGQSFTELIKLTHKDLIELICLCEEMTGKQIFNFGPKKGKSLINPNTLPDDGKSLQQKIDEINNHIGQSR